MAAGGAVVVVFGGWATRTLCGGKNKVLGGGFSFQRFCGGFLFVQSGRGCVFAACAGPVGGVNG